LTVWSASLLNLVLALAARLLAARAGAPAVTPRESTAPAPAAAAPVALVLVAAAAVGFAFLVMELVWYRMLTPLLGGSSYTFGLILAIALLGIGVGGVTYAESGRARRPVAAAFAFTCALEALCMALPYALGDGVALFALAAGFGLMPLPTAPGVWRLIVYLLLAVAATVAAYAGRVERVGRAAIATAVVGAMAAAACWATGPTAFWRHSPIGAGRMHLAL